MEAEDDGDVAILNRGACTECRCTAYTVVRGTTTCQTKGVPGQFDGLCGHANQSHAVT